MTHTSMGRLMDHLTGGDITEEYTHDPEVAEAARMSLLAMLTGIPHYVMADKLVDMVINDFKTKKLMKSVKAMVQAGVAKLPFDPILMEFRYEEKTAFVRMQSTPLNGEPMEDMDFYGYPVLTKVDHRPSNPGGLLMASIDPKLAGIPVLLKPGGDVEQPFMVFSDWTEGLNEDVAIAVVLATALAMLMLNTKGVIAEHVDVSKLNKARAKSGKGKRPVSPYTVVRIGHVYDAAGKAHSVTGSGRHMPVHWRAGHIRNMRYGPAGPRGAHIPKEERPTRPVYIEPCLVNFDPGESAPPVPHKEIVL